MGGFALHDADKSFLRVLDEPTLEELAKTGKIEWPTITKKEIQDRNKADIFSKGVVLLQTTWFIIQCVSRFATKLTVTELEVVTLASAVLNGITYWLWWDKPSDVRCAVPVYLKSADQLPNSELGSKQNSDLESKVSKARRQRDTSTFPSTKEDGFFACRRNSFRHRRNEHGLIPTILYTLLWAPIKVIFGPLWVMMGQDSTEIPDDDITRVPTFYSPSLEADKEVLGLTPSLWTMVGVIVLFGAIHFIPWGFTFPTATERWLWRVSAILITGGPLLTMLPIIVHESVSELNLIMKIILRFSGTFMAFTLIPAYIVSRIVLLILPLILLDNLPSTAFLELKWSEFFPHI